jgi:tRNA (cmo5U34)-methyltransferase
LVNNNKDSIIPSDKWIFNQEVTTVFDNMLERSIPDYLNMRSLVNSLTLKYLQNGSSVLDLGCSTGGAIKDIIDLAPKETEFIGVEISEPMREQATQNLQKFVDTKQVKIINCDLREDFPISDNSVVLSVLTIQFIPIEHRQRIISSIYENLISGGVFIFVEKILGNDSIGNSMLEDLYYKLKGENGYTEEQIRAKRKSLEGVLVPVTSDWNIEMMSKAGFSNIQQFWQQLNFAGWVGFKK